MKIGNHQPYRVVQVHGSAKIIQTLQLLGSGRFHVAVSDNAGSSPWSIVKDLWVLGQRTLVIVYPDSCRVGGLDQVDSLIRAPSDCVAPHHVTYPT